MKTKGKTRAIEITQQKALEFDEKYRKAPIFKKDLLSLRKEFGGDETLFFQANNPRAIPQYDMDWYEEQHNVFSSKLQSMDVVTFYRFIKNVSEFMKNYGFGREWEPHIMQLVLIGIYDVPEKNYCLGYDEKYPTNISIIVNQYTTDEDVKDALSESQKRLPSINKKKKLKGKSYSWIDDTQTVDALKEALAYVLNLEQLSPYEQVLFKQSSKNLKDFADEIFQNRRKRRNTGENVEVKRPPLENTVSDRDYYKRYQHGSDLEKSIAKLKKQRQRFK